jgi:DNA-binding NtrC family response regulator
MTDPGNGILIVDDDRNLRFSLRMCLLEAGYTNIHIVDQAHDALEMIDRYNVSVVLLDLILPDIRGDELLQEIERLYPDVVVIIITGVDDIETAVACMKNGAFDYIVKPFDANRLATTVAKGVGVFELRRENTLIKHSFLEHTGNEIPEFAKIVTDSENMKSLFKYCSAISQTSHPVLVCGETGVGKELFAEAIHQLSNKTGTFVAVNTAGIDSNVFADTFFGHVRGAFTGASYTRKGLIEHAARGSIFLDEIGDLSQENQVKLLRLLQENSYSPLGADEQKYSDARIIAATNKNLKEQVENGSFREDLYYRLRTHQVNIPPLRERVADIKVIFEFYLESAFAQLGRKVPAYPRELISLLKNYSYPGNVRELMGMVFDAAAQHDSNILSMHSFENHMGIYSNKESLLESKEEIVFPDILPTLEVANIAIITEALRRTDNNQSLAAKLLGVSQQTLNYRIKKMKMN